MAWVSFVLVGFFAGLLIGGGLAFFARKNEQARHVDLERRNADLEARLTLEREQRDKDRTDMDLAFRAAAQDALKASQEQFLTLAREKLVQTTAESAFDLEKRQKSISAMVEPIGKTLKDMETRIETLGQAGKGLETQLQTFAQDQRLLRQETQNLVQALRNPTARGRWGEMQLERTFEMIGMIEGTHYVQQRSAVSGENKTLRPDFVIRLPGGMEIVIDVKAPMEPYWKTLESAQSESERDEDLRHFAIKVRDHLKQLGSKEYWRNFNSPEFVVMFLPTEGLYSLAVSTDRALIEDAARQNIILASPTTIMGLLRVAMHGWQQQRIAEEAKTVCDLASELYRRIATFGEHMQKVGKNLGSAVNTYNQAVGSLESSVLPGARKFRDLQIATGGKAIPDLAEIETAPRTPRSEPLPIAQAGEEEKKEPVAA